jgi:type 1 glutamine amidotransferase
VDQKSYPMGFVLESTTRRVFHCPLGHDQNALQSEGARELYRSAARWAVQLKTRGQ